MSETKVIYEGTATKEYRVLQHPDGPLHCEWRNPGEEWEDMGESHYIDELARLAAEVRAKDAEIERLRGSIGVMADLDNERNEEIERLREALRELVNCGVEHDDERIPYLTVQIDRETLDTARRALAGERADGEEG